MKYFLRFLAPDGADAGAAAEPVAEAAEAPAAEAAPQAEAAPATDPFGMAEKAGATAPNQQEQEAAPVVPEKYEFHLADGLEIGDELAAKFTEIAKGANMSQATVDKLLEMHGSIIQEALGKAEEQKNGWAQECMKQGLNTQADLQKAALAVDTFGGGGAMQALIDTGAAYHPAVQKMLQSIGGLLSEDTGADGAPGNPTRNIGDIMFPNSK